MNISKYCLGRVKRFRASLVYLLLLMLCSITLPVCAEANRLDTIAILPFEMVDNTPVPGGQSRNQQMLEKLTQFITDGIKQQGIFQIIPQTQVRKVVDSAQLGTDIRNCNQCEYDLGRELQSDKVMTGWIYKMSILILTMHIEIKDVANEKTLISKAYDFRGDNEKAWLRAAKYMLRDLQQMMQK